MYLFLGFYVMNVNYNEFLFLFVKYIYKKQLILSFFFCYSRTNNIVILIKLVECEKMHST